MTLFRFYFSIKSRCVSVRLPSHTAQNSSFLVHMIRIAQLQGKLYLSNVCGMAGWSCDCRGLPAMGTECTGPHVQLGSTLL